MSRLGELQNAYLNSLSSLKRISNKGKSDDKKNDESKNDSTTNTMSLPKPNFPITPNMFILSACFWTIMFVLIYECIVYGTMYSRITMEADLHRKCQEKFGSEDENLNKVDNYSFGVAQPYIFRLKPAAKAKEDYPMETTTLPPFVTAVSTSEFFQLQGLINHIMEDLMTSQSDIKLLVYDIGLYKKERELIEKYCHCEVRDFPFQEYPRHVSDITNYAWRPIMLQIVLEEFGSAVYIEATTRFKTDLSLNFLKRRGSKGYFLWDLPIYTSLVSYTATGMFEFLDEQRCTFLDTSILSSEAIVLYRTEKTWRELMKPWLKCALNEDCIAPQYATYSGCFELRHPHTTGCHRYDMSALSIILNRGVQYTVRSGKMISFRLTYKDETITLYFPEQPWTYAEICLLILSPFLLFILYKFLFKRRRCKL
ncbi:uncharacterized protein LOC106071276 [Biomphalaria glabrata]|uniref:Uncharacterized protein LOC106071276 n=1 Tax=Biomphalaria glabrata TaxID=6526 RepID=A0A9W2YLL9_BIOGL|nr:uncharacterized protein LOC106071276 [Biomphalaria glabrata]